MATIKEILKQSILDRKNSEYNATAKGAIEKVVIDGITFTDYKAFSFLWEKSYVKSPTRSANGTIGNLDSYATFLTPRLKIDFGLLSIDSYRDLMNLIYEKNEFLVTCYDIVHNKPTTNRMYFATEEMPKLLAIGRAINGESWVEVLGVEEYTVEMIGTNVPTDTVKVNYYLNVEGGQTTPIYSEDFAIGQEILIGNGVDNSLLVANNKEFNNSWNTVANPTNENKGSIYLQNQAYRIGQDKVDETTKTISLYAQWKPTMSRILSFAYGLGTQKYNSKNEPITSIKINNGQSFKEAIENANITLLSGKKLTNFPNSDNILTIKIGEEYHNTYYFKGWYYNSVIGVNAYGQEQLPLSLNDIYNVYGDAAIYQIYEPYTYSITFYSNGGTSFNSMQAVPYKSNVALPTPYKDGYTFEGWYLDSSFKEKFNGTMLPYNITLHAKWGK